MRVLATIQTQATQDRVDFFAAARAYAPIEQRNNIPLLPLPLEEVKTRMFRGFEVVDDAVAVMGDTGTSAGTSASTGTSAGAGTGAGASHMESGTSDSSPPTQAPPMQRIFNDTPPPPESV